jgi:hypothetical protein
MKLHCVLLTASLAVTAVAAVRADEIEEQIQRAQKAYSEQDYREAINELQFAISQIQEKLSAQYVTLLPEPLTGWEADPAETQTMPMALMGGGTQLSRRYHKTEGEEEQVVTIEILADSPMLQAVSMMLTNPTLISSEPGTRPYRHQQYRGVIKQDQANRTTEVSLIVANRILVKVTGENLADTKPVEAYLSALDFKKLEAAMAK